MSALAFGLLHSNLALWGLLGGIEGLYFLSERYIQAILISFVALVILIVLGLTSIGPVMRRLGPLWKRIHRLSYIAGMLLVIHALLLGTHFSDLASFIPQIFFTALVFLLVLEAVRFDHYLSNKFFRLPHFSPIFTLIISQLAIASTFLFLPVGLSPSFGIHSAHIELAQQAQSGGGQTSSIPGLTGDRTKHYAVAFEHEAALSPELQTTVSFTVTDAGNGSATKAFQTLYEKTSHLIIVDDALEYFNHVHPTLEGSTFTMQTTFPHPGMYHLYLDFQPFGAIEQQFGFSLKVGEFGTQAGAVQVPDKTLSKKFGSHQVTLILPGALKANDMALGKQLLKFTIKDAQGNGVRNLGQYLGAYGHLVMIDEKTYDYIHVHPNVLAQAGAKGGPEVAFLPIGIYGKIKSGTYRIFAQFNPSDGLFTADFTVKVE